MPNQVIEGENKMEYVVTRGIVTVLYSKPYLQKVHAKGTQVSLPHSQSETLQVKKQYEYKNTNK